MNFGGLFEHLSMMAADTLLLAPLDDVALSEETVHALRAPDPRSTPQRLSEGGVKPRVTMTVSAEHLLALQMNGIPGAKVPTAAATFEWTGPVSLPTAQMTVCDSVITKILLDNNAVPLEVGREFRTVTPAIRKALIARGNEPLAA
ncbi:hypothetical protein [Williamsia sp. 1138]|uniref:hypothetical protein n=1 Tax=Williamsia sp. 1138 TaxID=1903117 RepID=UPI001FED937B|nr:hypothetical protein [Williamsia sp. 1138]